MTTARLFALTAAVTTALAVVYGAISLGIAWLAFQGPRGVLAAIVVGLAVIVGTALIGYIASERSEAQQ